MKRVLAFAWFRPPKVLHAVFSESKTASFGRCLHEPTLFLLLLVCCICAYMFYSLIIPMFFFSFPLFSLMMRIMEMDELDVGGIMMPRGKCTIWLLCMIN
jgi:hypothetical protein